MILALGESACVSYVGPDSSGEPASRIPTPTTLVSVQGIPHAIALDETQIYWSSLGSLNNDGTWNTKVLDGSIMKADKNGNNVNTLASGLYPPWAISLDSTDVYWISADGIKKVSKNGGPVTSLVSWQPPGLPYTPDIELTLDIAVDATSVYWSSCGSDSIMKIAKSQGTPIVLASAQSCPMRIALDTDHIYWIDRENDGSVMKASKDGKQLTNLLAHKGGLADIAVDGSGVYWINGLDFFNRQDGAVTRLPVNGDAPTQIASGQKYPEHLVIDANYLYWVEGPEQTTLMKMPKSGGAPQQVISGNEFIAGVALDAKDIYMAFYGRRAIVKVQK